MTFHKVLPEQYQMLKLSTPDNKHSDRDASVNIVDSDQTPQNATSDKGLTVSIQPSLL